MPPKEQPGMRRERNAERTQEVLLNTAEEIFAQYGFDGARMDMIARRSSYNIALLFRYFESKEGIYRAVIERLRSQENDSLGRLIAPLIADEATALDPEQVRHFLEVCCSWYFYLASRHPHLLRLLGWQMDPDRSLFPDLPASNGEVQWGKAAVAFLQRAQAAGLLRANLDVRLIIVNMFLLSMMHVLTLPQQQPSSAMEESSRASTLEDLCHKVIDMVLYGIFPSPDNVQ
ncbi:MAG TPA: TetR/AcrR family transcriptional regulator [Ktedonobacteraceae bacterium]|jgi:AcrR family transcriptional regulator|nr:TetR/AcrR family transcriptional regulator [Ktedonobacteraceae bacterium]